MFTKTFDSIIAGFTRTIEDLEALAEREEQAAIEKQHKVAKLNQEKAQHISEAARAGDVAERLKLLLT